MAIDGIRNEGNVKQPVAKNNAKKKLEVKLNVGEELLKNSDSSQVFTKVGVQGAIPIGKTSEIQAKADVNVAGLGGHSAELKYSKDVNSKLSLNGGVGYRNNKFNQKSNTKMEHFFEQRQTEINGGDPMYFYKEDYTYSGLDISTAKSKSQEKTLYGTVGADYKLNKKLSMSGSLDLGKKDTKGAEFSRTKTGEYTYVEKEGKMTHYEPEDVWAYSPAETASVTKTQLWNIKQDKSAFVGNLNVGADYKVSNKVDIGINGKIPLNNKSDHGVNATIRYKF